MHIKSSAVAAVLALANLSAVMAATPTSDSDVATPAAQMSAPKETTTVTVVKDGDECKIKFDKYFGRSGTSKTGTPLKGDKCKAKKDGDDFVELKLDTLNLKWFFKKFEGNSPSHHADKDLAPTSMEVGDILVTGPGLHFNWQKIEKLGTTINEGARNDMASDFAWEHWPKKK